MKTRLNCFVMGILLAASVPCWSAVIGDPAPGTAIERWIKGNPVAIVPGTNVYIVEFWATWCGPCKRTMPHLSELHRQYARKGLIIVGVSDEPADKVSKFVAEQGENMAYRVAVDTSRRTFKSWMDAYGGTGIPHAFIVDQAGKVAWHGFPEGDYFTQSLEEILSGKYDITAARHLEMGNRLIAQYENLINSGRDRQKAADIGEKIITDYALDWRIPHRLARLILTDKDLRSRDYKLALKATTKATQMPAHGWDAVDLHARALYLNGQAAEAVAEQEKAMKACTDAAELSNMEKRKAVYQKKAAS